MAITVSDFDFESVVRRLPSREKATIAASRAINRAMTAGRVQATREITKEYAVKARQVNAKLTTSRATRNNLEASLTWRGHALNLAEFRVNPRKPQPARRPLLRALVKRSSGYVPFKRAFMVSSNGLAYRRVTGASRYPITQVWGPSIPNLLGAKTVQEAVESRAKEVLESRLDHEISRMLEGK